MINFSRFCCDVLFAYHNDPSHTHTHTHSLVPRPIWKIGKGAWYHFLVLFVAKVNVIKRVLRYDTPYCNRWSQLTIMRMHARWSKSELNKWCCSVLSSMFSLSIQIGCTLSIHKFRQITSVYRDPSQCQQTIKGFVSIIHMGKQHFPISITHWSHANTILEAITSYSTKLHSSYFWPNAHVTGSCSAWFHSAIWWAPQNYEM